MNQLPPLRLRETAFDDSARRVRYLKQFCALVRNAKTLRGLEGGLENIRADLANIQSETVRHEARARLDRTVGASFLALERTPERFATTLRDGLQGVIAYLERNDR